MRQEGVIKFESAHQTRSLDPHRFGELACRLMAWRRVMSLTRLVGQDPERYEGAGYGNVSGRIGPPNDSLGHRSFLITATQTSGRSNIDLASFAVIEQYDFSRNQVTSYGQLRPSSESLTHGAIYDHAPHIRCVLHAHSPSLWRRSGELRLPTTDPRAAYGTPEMAREVQRVFRETAAAERQIISMGGHEDGILAFGRSTDEAGGVLISELARAYELENARLAGLIAPGRSTVG